jgi:hypothetical protein
MCAPSALPEYVPFCNANTCDFVHRDASTLMQKTLV